MTEILREMLDLRAIYTKLVQFVPHLLVALLILLAFWIFYRATQGALRTLLHRAGLEPPLVHLLIDNIYHTVLILFALIMAADQVGINVGAALAGLGVAGIAIGFAAQDSLANIIAGFVIFWDQPFRVHDWVRVADQYGQVMGITLRTTRIRTRNNTYVVIPNRKVIDEVLVNHSKHGETRVEVPVGIAYKESIPEARRVLLDALKELPELRKDPPPDVVVVELGDSSVNLHARAWIDDASHEQPIFFLVLETCKLALDRAGIEIPYPHLQLFVENVQDRVWEKAERLRSGGSVSGGGPVSVN